MTSSWCKWLHIYRERSVAYTGTTKLTRRRDHHSASTNTTSFADTGTQISRMRLQPEHFSIDFERLAFDPLLLFRKSFWFLGTVSRCEHFAVGTGRYWMLRGVALMGRVVLVGCFSLPRACNYRELLVDWARLIVGSLSWIEGFSQFLCPNAADNLA